MEADEIARTAHIIGDGIRSILRNGTQLMGLNWVESALRALYLVVMARWLGAEQYGHWAYGAAAYGLVLGLTNFGLDTLMSIRLGADKREAPEYLGLTFALRAGLLALGAAALAGYALVVESDPTSRLVLLLLLPALVGRGVALWARLCFLGYERMGEQARFASLMRLAEVAIGSLWLVGGGDVVGVVAIHGLSWLVEGALGLARVRRRLAPFVPRFERRGIGGLLAQGAVLGLAAGLYTWLVAGPVILIRHAVEDMTELGQLAVVLNGTMILVSSAQAFFGAALPVLSRAAERKDPRVARYSWLTLLLSLATGVVAGGLGWLVGAPLAAWALGPEYAVAGRLAGPFLVVGGVMLAPTGFAQALVLSDRRWPGALANLCAGALLVLAMPAATSSSGIDGAVVVVGAAWALRAAVVVVIGALVRNTPSVAD